MRSRYGPELPLSASDSALDPNRRGRCQYEEQRWPELPPFASDSDLALNRRGMMSARGADIGQNCLFLLRVQLWI